RGTVNVLGTRFEFSTEETDARIVVVDGKVDFSAGSEDARLEIEGGQMATARLDAPPVLAPVENLEMILDWMGQALVFEHTPLEQAAREIETRYGAVIELRSDALRGQTITGGFKDRSFDEIVTTICRVMAADCTIDGAHAVITSRPIADVSPVPVSTASLQERL